MTSTNPLRTLRRLLGDRLANLVDYRVDQLVRGRLDQQDARITEQEHCTVDHRRRLDELESELKNVRGDLLWTSGEVKRLIPHVAAQETQLEELRARLALTPSSDDRQAAEARTLIEEIQRQHAQIRTRLSGVARYEDRLRQLEERAVENANG